MQYQIQVTRQKTITEEGVAFVVANSLSEALLQLRSSNFAGVEFQPDAGVPIIPEDSIEFKLIE